MGVDEGGGRRVGMTNMTISVFSLFAIEEPCSNEREENSKILLLLMKASGEFDPIFGSFTNVKNVMRTSLYVSAYDVKTIIKQNMSFCPYSSVCEVVDEAISPWILPQTQVLLRDSKCACLPICAHTAYCSKIKMGHLQSLVGLSWKID